MEINEKIYKNEVINKILNPNILTFKKKNIIIFSIGLCFDFGYSGIVGSNLKY